MGVTKTWNLGMILEVLNIELGVALHMLGNSFDTVQADTA